MIAHVVAQCLASAGQNRRVVVVVNPAQLADLEAGLEQLRKNSDTPTLIARPDPSVAPGGCVLETDAGEVDGRLETQLAAIKAALRPGDDS